MCDAPTVEVESQNEFIDCQRVFGPTVLAGPTLSELYQPTERCGTGQFSNGNRPPIGAAGEVNLITPLDNS